MSRIQVLTKGPVFLLFLMALLSPFCETLESYSITHLATIEPFHTLYN
jgi:hypothetical protein